MDNDGNEATFVFDATKTVYGAFLCSHATSDSAAEILLSTAAFDEGNQAVQNAYSATVEYTVDFS